LRPKNLSTSIKTRHIIFISSFDSFHGRLYILIAFLEIKLMWC
jgi:hypothetical protein